MSLVWRKIQRSNKKAAKFSFDASLKELSVQCTAAWQPGRLCVAWAHRRRRVVGRAYNWEPSIFDSFKGTILWPPDRPEKLQVLTTLYRHPREEAYETKEWTFLVEEVRGKGRPRAIAAVSLNLPMFIASAASPSTTTELKLKLRPLTDGVTGATLQLVLTATMLRQGDAIDDDMASIASHLSRTASLRSSREVSPLGTEEDLPGTSAGEELRQVSHSIQGFVEDRKAVAAEPPPGLPTLQEAPSPRTSADHPPASPLVKRRDSPGRKRRFGPNGELVRPDLSQRDPPSSPPGHLNGSAQKDKDQKVFSSGLVLSVTGGHKEPSEEEKRKSQPPPVPTVDPAAQAAIVQARLKAAGVSGSGDLEAWCRAVTADYRGVRVKDMCESFRSGLAFCAIVNFFRPDLLDYESRPPKDIRGNCEAAFAAAEGLGVPRILNPEDFVIRKIPDKISIVAYVHSLRQALTRSSMASQMSESASSAGLGPREEPTSPGLEAFHSFLEPDEEEVHIQREFERFSMRRQKADREFAEANTPKKAVSTRTPPQPTKKSPSPGSPGRAKRRSKRKGSSRSSEGSADDATPPAPLMSPDELTDPFGQVADEAGPSKAEEVAASPIRDLSERRRSSDSPLVLPDRPIDAAGSEREAELKRKARELLSQYTAAHAERGREATPEEGRQRELRERAKHILAQVTTDAAADRPATLPRGTSPFDPADPRGHTPEQNGVRRQGSGSRLRSGYELASSQRSLRRKSSLSSLDPKEPLLTDDEDDQAFKPLSRSGSMKLGVPFYQYRSNSKLAEWDSDAEPEGSHSPERPRVPIFAAPGQKMEAALRDGTEASGRAIRIDLNPRPPPQGPPSGPPPGDSGTLDRWKRYGSMRGGELATSISRVHERFQRLPRIGSSSVPQQLSEALARRTSAPRVPVSQSLEGRLPCPAEASAEASAKLAESAWERQLATGRARIEQELKEVEEEMGLLDERSVQTEKEWRAVIEKDLGSDKEAPLQNAYVAAINERNVLLRREEHLQLLLQIQDKEEAFKRVEAQLRNWTTMEESEKTEGDKRRIDALMRELTEIVNQKDILVTQIMDNEAGTEEDQSLPNHVPLPSHGVDDEKCSIM